MNVLKFYSPERIIYEIRMRLQGIQTWEDLSFWYLSNEPQSLASIGNLNKFISKNNLNNSTTLNIGVDFLKEV